MQGYTFSIRGAQSGSAGNGLKMILNVSAVPGPQTKWDWAIKPNARIRNGTPLREVISLTAWDEHDNPTEDFWRYPGGVAKITVIPDASVAPHTQASCLCLSFHVLAWVRKQHHVCPWLAANGKHICIGGVLLNLCHCPVGYGCCARPLSYISACL